jgi:hypothetical protein
MTFSLKLGYLYSDCPLVWQRFISHTQHCIHGPGNSSNTGLSKKEIKKALSQFNAEYLDTAPTEDGVVDFPSERHYNLFILKYGE